MTAEKQISMTITQDLTNGEVKFSTSGERLSFPIANHLVLLVLKVLKDNVISSILKLPEAEFIAKSFPNATIPTSLKNLTPEQLREVVASKAEGEMYDMLNLSISEFLDNEFPRINDKLSLTEQAAKASNLDNSATPEELIKAENDFVEKNPELAAQTQELQPKEVLRMGIDKNGNPTAHPDNLTRGLNRAARRLNKK